MTWLELLPFGVPHETLWVGTPVVDRRGRHAVVAGAWVRDGVPAIVVSDEGMLWDVAAADVRYDLGEHLGMASALLYLGPRDCDAARWDTLIAQWATLDIDDEDRVDVAWMIATEREDATRRAYEQAGPEERAQIDRSWEAMPADLFAGATLEAGWHKTPRAECGAESPEPAIVDGVEGPVRCTMDAGHEGPRHAWVDGPRQLVWDA